jgi:carboxyl-terminal processing protease
MNLTKTIKWILLMAITLVSFKSYAQTDSIYHNRLYYLCKVWGHVKYYHTEVANGSVNWDDELLVAIDSVRNTSSNEAFNDALEAMINNAGTMGTSTDTLPIVPDSLNNNTDLDWVYSPILSDSVSALLDNITQKFKPQSNTYVNGTSIYNLFTDYLYCCESDYPDEDKRLLALFRYWNIIHYFYPYKDEMQQPYDSTAVEQPWDISLVEFIPKIVAANNELNYLLTFKQFTTRINDSHAYFSNSTYWDWYGWYYPPFQVRYIEGQTVVSKVRNGEPNIKVGDVIKKIDGLDIEVLRDSLRPYAHGSNSAYKETIIDDMILWGDIGGFEVDVDDGTDINSYTKYRNDNNYSNLNINTNPVWKRDTTATGCQIGIVDMGLLEVSDLYQMFNDIWDTDAIIFDVRNYPNGTIWSILDYLHPFNTTINFANFTIPDTYYPGTFFWASQTDDVGNGNPPYAGKIMILFDERTISHAEYTCMGLETFPETIKIGSTTAGADGNVTRVFLPGSIVTNFTFFGTYYPDYSPTQRIGIVPDYEVLPTILGVRNGEDEVMDFALNFMDCGFTATEEIVDDQEFTIYPNPVNHYLQYELPESYLSKKVLFEIVDIQGRTLKTVSKNSLSGEIDFSTLNSGLYFVKVITNNNILIKTIFKN